MRWVILVIVIVITLSVTTWVFVSDKHKNRTAAVTFFFGCIVSLLVAFIPMSTYLTYNGPQPEELYDDNEQTLPIDLSTAPVAINDAIPSQTESESWIRLRTVMYDSLSEELYAVRFSVTVEYKYEGDNPEAVVAIHGNNLFVDSWTSFGTTSDIVIGNGYGKHTFEVDVQVPEWNEFSFIAYIHPLTNDDEWFPIAISEPVDIDVKIIYETYTMP